jgi:hypothetical protein
MVDSGSAGFSSAICFTVNKFATSMAIYLPHDPALRLSSGLFEVLAAH